MASFGSYQHMSILNSIYYTDREFLEEIKAEFLLMYKRNGHSKKVAIQSFDEHICMGLLNEDKNLGILDYRFTKKSKEYFEEKAKFCVELNRVRKEMIFNRFSHEEIVNKIKELKAA